MRLKQMEWTGVALQIVGAIMLASNTAVSPWAYPLMLAGALLWCAAAWYQRLMPALTLHGAFAAINVIGLVRWLA